MQSGIGDQAELGRLGIPVAQHLPGVGQGFQDHPQFACVWEYRDPLPRGLAPAVLFWPSAPSLESPDLQILPAGFPQSSAENAARFGLPASGWTLIVSLMQPKSRGRIRLTGPDPLDPVRIEANHLSDPDDLRTAIACVELWGEIGNSPALRPFAKREVMPGSSKRPDLENYIRDAVTTYWHQSCTARMGCDATAVVDGDLRVYGIDNLRVADGSIMPRVTTGNTQAACVIIGERAAEALRAEHKLESSSPELESDFDATSQCRPGFRGHTIDRDRIRRLGSSVHRRRYDSLDSRAERGRTACSQAERSRNACVVVHDQGRSQERRGAKKVAGDRRDFRGKRESKKPTTPTGRKSFHCYWLWSPG